MCEGKRWDGKAVKRLREISAMLNDRQKKAKESTIDRESNREKCWTQATSNQFRLAFSIQIRMLFVFFFNAFNTSFHINHNRSTRMKQVTTSVHSSSSLSLFTTNERSREREMLNWIRPRALSMSKESYLRVKQHENRKYLDYVYARHCEPTTATTPTTTRATTTSLAYFDMLTIPSRIFTARERYKIKHENGKKNFPKHLLSSAALFLFLSRSVSFSQRVNLIFFPFIISLGCP